MPKLTEVTNVWKNIQEIDLLVTYVEDGGLLVLTNSANRLFFDEPLDANEDLEKANALAAPFGISYESDPFPINVAIIASAHPLTENLSRLRLINNNGTPINLGTGETLAELGERAALGLVDYGEAGGQVLVLSDLGSLDLYDFGRDERNNFTFMRNLASYACER
jgi:hypothetical protein